MAKSIKISYLDDVEEISIDDLLVLVSVTPNAKRTVKASIDKITNFLLSNASQLGAQINSIKTNLTELSNSTDPEFIFKKVAELEERIDNIEFSGSSGTEASNNTIAKLSSDLTEKITDNTANINTLNLKSYEFDTSIASINESVNNIKSYKNINLNEPQTMTIISGGTLNSIAANQFGYDYTVKDDSFVVIYSSNGILINGFENESIVYLLSDDTMPISNAAHVNHITRLDYNNSDTHLISLPLKQNSIIKFIVKTNSSANSDNKNNNANMFKVVEYKLKQNEAIKPEDLKYLHIQTKNIIDNIIPEIQTSINTNKESLDFILAKINGIDNQISEINKKIDEINKKPSEPSIDTLTISLDNNLTHLKALNSDVSFSYTSNEEVTMHEISYDNGLTWDLLNETNISTSRENTNKSYSFKCTLQDLNVGIYNVKIKITDKIQQEAISDSFKLVVLDSTDEIDKYIFSSSSLNGLNINPHVMPEPGEKPLKMYGRVNKWHTANRNTLAQELIKCYENNIHGYHIEFGGWAETSIWKNPNIKEKAKNTFKWLIDKCRKLGLWLFVSIANDNMSANKYGNSNYITNLYDLQIFNDAKDIAKFILDQGPDNLLIQPTAESGITSDNNLPENAKDESGNIITGANNFDKYCASIYKQSENWITVYNGNNGNPSSTIEGFTYLAKHPSNINNINDSYAGAIMSTDHGNIIREILNLGSGEDIRVNTIISESGNNWKTTLNNLYTNCINAKCVICCIYMFNTDNLDVPAIVEFGSI